MLKLVELELYINENGFIELPMQVLEQMEIHTGEAIRLVYMAEGEEDLVNPSKEFLLTRKDRDVFHELAKEEAVDFKIPSELLADAGIPMGADLEIVCMDKKILIHQAEEVSVEEVIPPELLAIFEELGISSDKVQIVLKSAEEDTDEQANL